MSCSVYIYIYTPALHVIPQQTVESPVWPPRVSCYSSSCLILEWCLPSHPHTPLLESACNQQPAWPVHSCNLQTSSPACQRNIVYNPICTWVQLLGPLESHYNSFSDKMCMFFFFLYRTQVKFSQVQSFFFLKSLNGPTWGSCGSVGRVVCLRIRGLAPQYMDNMLKGPWASWWTPSTWQYWCVNVNVLVWTSGQMCHCDCKELWAFASSPHEPELTRSKIAVMFSSIMSSEVTLMWVDRVEIK